MNSYINDLDLYGALGADNTDTCPAVGLDCCDEAAVFPARARTSTESNDAEVISAMPNDLVTICQITEDKKVKINKVCALSTTIECSGKDAADNIILDDVVSYPDTSVWGPLARGPVLIGKFLESPLAAFGHTYGMPDKKPAMIDLYEEYDPQFFDEYGNLKTFDPNIDSEENSAMIYAREVRNIVEEMKSFEDKTKELMNYFMHSESAEIRPMKPSMTKEVMIEKYGYFIRNCIVDKTLKNSFAVKVEERRILKETRARIKRGAEMASSHPRREARRQAVAKILDMFDPVYIYDEYELQEMDEEGIPIEHPMFIRTHHDMRLELKKKRDDIRDRFNVMRKEVETRVGYMPKRNSLLQKLAKEEKRELRALKKSMTTVMRSERCDNPIVAESGFTGVTGADINGEYENYKVKYYFSDDEDGIGVDMHPNYYYYLKNIFPDMDKVGIFLDILGPIVDLFYRFYRSSNLVDIGMAVYSFIDRALCKVSSVLKKSMIESLFNVFMKVGKYFMFVKDDSKIKSESASDVLKLVNGYIGKFLTSNIYIAVRNVVLSILSFKLFNKDVSFKMYEWLGKPEKMNFLDVIKSLFVQMQTFCQFGEAIYSGVPFVDAFTSTDPNIKFTEDVRELLSFVNRTYGGLPVDGKMCRSTFISKAQKLVCTGEFLMKKMPIRMPERQVMHKEVLAVRNALLAEKGRENGGKRPPPVGIILHGPPGIGKSAILSHLMEIHSKVKGRIFQSDQVYCRVVTSQYWENYDPYSQPYVHYTELGNKHVNLAKTQGDDAVTELTQVMDSNPLSLDMAFEDKGTVFCRPEMVIIDTNCPDLNLHSIVRNPTAYHRRFIYIEPQVKPEFLSEKGVGIDIEKSLNHGTPILDRWTFNVTTYSAIDKTRDESTCHLSKSDESSDIYALTEVLTKLFASHIRKQELTLEGLAGEGNIDKYMNRPPCGESLLDNTINAQPIKCEAGEWIPEIPRVAARLIPRVPIMKMFLSSQMHYFVGVSWFQFFVMTGVFASLGWACGALSALVLWLPDRRKRTVIYDWAFHATTGLLTWYFSGFWWCVYSMSILVGFATRATVIVSPLSRHLIVLFLSRKADEISFWYKRNLETKLGKNPFESEWWKQHGPLVLKVCGLSLTAMAAYKWYTGNKEEDERILASLIPVNSEAHSDLKLDDENNKAINEFEEEVAAGTSYRRIAIKGVHNAWNVRTEFGEQCPHKADFKSLQNCAQKNVRHCRVGLTGTVKTFLLGVKSNYALINTHALGGHNETLIRVSLTGGIDDNCDTYVVTQVSSINRVDLGNDITLIRLSGIQFRDLSKHFSDNKYPLDTYIGRFGVRDVTVTIERNHEIISSPGGEYVLTQKAKYLFPEHVAGSCGIPLIVNKNSGSCIAGFHTGARDYSDYGYSTLFDTGSIDEAISILEQNSSLVPLVSAGELRAEALLMPTPQSPFFYEKLHGVTYFGRTPGEIMMNQVSALKQNVCAKDVLKVLEEHCHYEISAKMVPPMLKPGKVDGVYVSPSNITLKKIASQRGHLDPELLNFVVEKISTHIIEGLVKKGVTHLKPLTMEVAINGIEQDEFIRRINSSTSAGFDFTGKKSKYLPIVLEEPGKLIREPISELKRRLVAMIGRYKDETTWRPVQEGLLKDEPREESKVKAGKTRMFYTSEVDYLIMSRMFLSPFFSLMVEHSDVFGCAIGINMMAGADNLVKKMEEFSPLSMAGDFKSFDTNMPFDIGHAAASIEYNVCKYFGYSIMALRVLRGLLTDALFPLISVNKDLMEAFGLQPSGKLGTAEDNCIRVLIMLVYAWYFHPDLRELEFFDHVLPEDYGDDLWSGIKEAISHLFNNLYFAVVCKEIFGIEYTSATKIDALKPHDVIEDISFLKRKFVYRKDLGRWVAPLALDSLYKSIQWRLPSTTVSQREQMASTFESCMWELFLHLEKDEYEVVRSKMENIFSKYYNLGEVYELPTHAYVLGRIFIE